MVFPYYNDACAIIVSMAQLLFMDLVTEEFYFNEYISAGYGQSAGVNTDGKYFALSNDNDVMVFNIREKVPVNFTKPFSAWYPLKGHVYLNKPAAKSCRFA